MRKCNATGEDNIYIYICLKSYQNLLTSCDHECCDKIYDFIYPTGIVRRFYSVVNLGTVVERLIFVMVGPTWKQMNVAVINVPINFLDSL
jgi:hypothetical protein